MNSDERINLEAIVNYLKGKNLDTFTKADISYEKKNEEFSAQFKRINSVLESKVDEVNKLFQESDIKFKLALVSDNFNPESNRKAMQVVLTQDEKKINLLEDPYLLLEGYVGDNNVRIVEGSSSSVGDVLNIDEITEETLSGNINKFIYQTINILKI